MRQTRRWLAPLLLEVIDLASLLSAPRTVSPERTP